MKLDDLITNNTHTFIPLDSEWIYSLNDTERKPQPTDALKQKICNSANSATQEIDELMLMHPSSIPRIIAEESMTEAAAYQLS